MAIPLLTFPGLLRVPGLRHGVTTRAGGVSRGSFSSLNLGRSTSDDASAITENGRLVAEAIGAARVRYPHQVHGTTVKVVTASDALPVGESDAVVTNEAGVALGVLGADCPGVVIVDPVRRALAVVHSGWRGTVAGIVTKSIALLCDRFGCVPEDCLAGIGPGIAARSYEVGPEVADAVRTRVPHGDRCVTRGRGDHSYVDLALAIRNQLESGGLRSSSIETMDLCTFAEPDLLFSHRRDGAETGRHGLVAVWTPESD